MIERGGSVYFPSYMATADIAAGRLFALTKTPIFHREVFAISKQAATQKWLWFASLIGRL